MSKKIITILLVIIAIALGYVYSTQYNKEKNINENTINKEQSEINVSEDINQSHRIEIGKPAPDFTLTDINGEDITLSNLKGKKVLLNFWATWCPYCVEEMPDLNKIYNENKDELVVVGVDVGEDIQIVNKFLRDNGVDYPIVLDTNGRVALKYNANISLPTSYIIDEEGIIKGNQLGLMTYDQMNSFIKK